MQIAEGVAGAIESTAFKKPHTHSVLESCYGAVLCVRGQAGVSARVVALRELIRLSRLTILGNAHQVYTPLLVDCGAFGST